MDVYLPLFARNGRQEPGTQPILFYPVSLERSSAAPDPCPTLSLLCLAGSRAGLPHPAIAKAYGRLPNHYSTAGTACQSAPVLVSSAHRCSLYRRVQSGRRVDVNHRFLLISVELVGDRSAPCFAGGSDTIAPSRRVLWGDGARHSREGATPWLVDCASGRNGDCSRAGPHCPACAIVRGQVEGNGSGNKDRASGCWRA